MSLLNNILHSVWLISSICLTMENLYNAIFKIYILLWTITSNYKWLEYNHTSNINLVNIFVHDKFRFNRCTFYPLKYVTIIEDLEIELVKMSNAIRRKFGTCRKNKTANIKPVIFLGIGYYTIIYFLLWIQESAW